jgi:predicted transposase YdaD
VTGPHDRLFRYTFAHPARAAALLRHNLPAPLTTAVDWSSLRRESGTLVDWGRETRRDLLFSARYHRATETEPPHFFLIEHQSTVDRWMALRTLDYSGPFIRHWHEVHPQSPWLPAMTPLVVYPRQGRSWSAPLRLEELYSVPAGTTGTWHRSPWVLCFEYLLDDLSTQSEEAIKARPGPALVPLSLLVLRLAGTEKLAQRLPHWSELFAKVYASSLGPQSLYRLVRYLQKLGDEQAYEAVKRVLHSIMQAERAEAFMRTMEEVLKERGREEGLAKGLAEGEARGEARGEAKGLARAVLQLLTARGVRLDEASRQRIQNCLDVATLERWHARAMNATDVSDVLDGPTQ